MCLRYIGVKNKTLKKHHLRCLSIKFIGGDYLNVRSFASENTLEVYSSG